MAKDYWLAFGSNPSTNTGLTPTFTIFQTVGSTATPPGITEPISGTGYYYFSFGTTASVAFIVDGGSGLSSGDRYISGVLDPIQVVDQRLGTVADSFGSTGIDPTTAIGYLKRNLEFSEGNADFLKSTGVWSIYSRGSSTLLRTKTLANSASEIDKT